MSKPYCKGCRHYREAARLAGPHVSWCTHDDAKIFSRISGYRPPVIRGGMGGSDETLSKCDHYGWFEEKPKSRKWWRIF